MKIDKGLLAPTILFLLLGVLAIPVLGASPESGRLDTELPSQGQALTAPYVSEPVYPADTRGLPPASSVGPSQDELRALPRTLPLPWSQQAPTAVEPYDPVVQTEPGLTSMPAPIMNFEGIAHDDVGSIFPPDTNGQVGSVHYVQIVNARDVGSQVRVWDKATGTQLYNFGLNNLWPLGNRCRLYGYGDPVVLYDQLADRWLLTEFTNPPSAPYNECIAVSKTDTPTDDPDDWWLYTFTVHNSKFNDYPKLGIWPDGYYMSANQFTSVWAGAGVWVFERDEMLNGDPARLVYFDVADLNYNYGGLLPSNLMGDTLPPAGAPNYFMSVDMNWVGANDILHIFEFHTDWSTPANSTFGLVQDLIVAPFDWNFSGLSGAEVPQPGTSQGLDNLADRLMMHLWYRNFGSYESLVTNHTVDAGIDHHGVRWYEIRGGTVDTTLADATIYQQSTYAPDSEHRWMGSIAMDRAGNMALGYSVSSETTYPSIRYVGRRDGDPLSTLPQTEVEVIAGSGSQTGSDSYGRGRWGDYSAMSVDPMDDCTFWYTQEYVEITGERNWQTRIASFHFPDCLLPPDLGIEKNTTAEKIEIGVPLVYTVVVTNAGGPATGVTISDTLPQFTDFAWADHSGAIVGDNVVWSDLSVPAGGEIAVSFGVTITCVPSGTHIVNEDYSVYAAEWMTPTFGLPVTVTTVQNGILADFVYPEPVLLNWPVPFTNLSQNATTYQWAFGDGADSNEFAPSHLYTGLTGDYTVVLTASNLCTSTVISQPLTVEDYGVTVYPSAAATTADPGQTVSYTLWITNVGTLSDTFRVSASGNQWPTQLSTDRLDLGLGVGAPVVVQVLVSTDADGGQTDSATIKVRPISDPRKPAASASAVLGTTANAVYGLELGPDTAAQEGYPGQTVTYTLRVTNTGNVADIISLTRTAPGWPTAFSLSSLTVPHDGEQTVEVYVTIPTSATDVVSDLATVRATGTEGYEESRLTTTAVWYKTYLPIALKNRP